MLGPGNPSTADVGAARGFGLGRHEFLDRQPIKTGVVRVELNPLGAGEGLAGVHQLTDEIRVEVGLQTVPTMLIDGGHESSQRCAGFHGSTITGPLRMVTVPNQLGADDNAALLGTIVKHVFRQG